MTVVPGQEGTAGLEAFPDPGIQDGALLVRGIAAGICGTDREIAEGAYGTPPSGEARLVIGHESLGEVLEAPPGSGFAPGDLVVGRRRCSGRRWSSSRCCCSVPRCCGAGRRRSGRHAGRGGGDGGAQRRDAVAGQAGSQGRPVYGSFATVAGMFALLYLVGRVLVYAAEVAAVPLCPAVAAPWT
jgi:threonine dehydrogenase-like Zn-dependent dehydrogenase